MCQTIDLNGYGRSITKEVENEWATWVLFAKAQSSRAHLKNSPQPDFGWAHSLTKLAGISNGQGPLHRLRRSPSARNRGEEVNIATRKRSATHLPMDVGAITALLVGYLLGSIPFGLLLTRWTGKGDIREIGSGNIGATNVLRTGSKGLAAATLLLDGAKGAVAVLLAQQLWPDAVNFAAAGALIGHLYPVWIRFKGGKGVATMLGIMIPLFWQAALVYVILWVGLLIIIRISSVAGMTAAASAPVTAAVLNEQALFPMLLGFALLVIWKHRENIRRLARGEEPRVDRRA